jgi:uncharacterized protein YmfQ (DUF2313 family)
MIFLRQLKHLLPRAKAWSLTIDKKLRQFFDGLSIIGSDFKIFDDGVYEDLFPETTRELDAWEAQFGLTDPVGLTTQQRRDRIDAAWKARGGQSPRYIQDRMQAAGFDVYVHEWWVPGTEPAIGVQACATARNPATYVPAGNFLVNKLINTGPVYLWQAGEAGAQAGEADIQCGNFTSFENAPTVYPAPTDPTKWPYVLYIGGAVFPTLVDIPGEQRDEFENLLLKICPAQQWLGLLVGYGEFGLSLSSSILESLNFVYGSSEHVDLSTSTLESGSS